jgi:hypothetical protein
MTNAIRRKVVTFDVRLPGTEAKILAAIGEKHGKNLDEIVGEAVTHYLGTRLRLVKVIAD